MVENRPLSFDEAGAWWRQYAWFMHRATDPTHELACMAADSMLTFSHINGFDPAECGLHLRPY